MKKYDLIIFGGGTSGCACAYISGMRGLKTLLIEKKIHLGGAITSSLVVPVMKSSDNQINTDFYNDLCDELKQIGGQITYMGNKGWFNPELTKIALDRMMKKARVDVLFGVEKYDFGVEGNKISSVILSEPIETKYIIDATGNADIAKRLGCKFLEEKYQPCSLRFQMSGIDLGVFSKWILDIDKDRDVTTSEVIDGQIHLSTACTSNGIWALQPLFREGVTAGILRETDCHYFQIFTVAGMRDSVNFNCPRIYSEPEINPLDYRQTSEGVVEARESIIRLSNFCRKYFKGFENAYISNIADELGVRVSRRICGKYVYTKNDLISGKRFDNPVLVGNYPIDIHSSNKDNSKLEKVMQDYELPIESLMSDDYDNLFVIGRCLSADFEAQGALRIQASCFSMGEGVAKYL